MALKDAIELAFNYLKKHGDSGRTCYNCHKLIKRPKKTLCFNCQKIMKNESLSDEIKFANLNEKKLIGEAKIIKMINDKYKLK